MNGLTLCSDWERFRALIATRFGLYFEDAKLGFLGDVLRRRLEALNQSSTTYLRALGNGPSYEETSALAQELTVPETYFFRNIAQFEVLAQVVLPARIAIPERSKVLRLLSAGCASGEEAYTLAIVARETIADPSWAVDIRAVDLNPVGLDKAKRARYSAWALRETPLDVQRKWFQGDGREMALDDAVRSAVKFAQTNLVVDDPEVWRPEVYDVIFCRNVLMYFAPEQARAVIARMVRSLAPGGSLFLGHAETMRGLSDAFHLRHSHGTFYYERKNNEHLTQADHPVYSSQMSSAPPLWSGDWVDVIGDASRRITAMVPQTSLDRETTNLHTPGQHTPKQALDMALILDLLGREHFSDALAYVRDWPLNSPDRPDALLIEAMAHVHYGALDEAQEVSLRLLDVDGLNAGAHYVLALCREGLGDRDGAIENDRVAVYLDPTFAMPRLHLGLLSRNDEDISSARRELGQALVLLKREDSARVLLFGGGFSRDALTALCESALKDCGGVP